MCFYMMHIIGKTKGNTMVIVIYKGSIRGEHDNHVTAINDRTFDQVINEIKSKNGYWNREEIEVIDTIITKREIVGIDKNKRVQ